MVSSVIEDRAIMLHLRVNYSVLDSIVDEIMEKSDKAPRTYIGRMLDPLHSNEYSVLNS